MYHFIFLIFIFVASFLFNSETLFTCEKLYCASTFLLMFGVDKLHSNIVYDFILLIYILIPFLFIKKDKYIKIYTSLCCLLFLAINVFVPNTYDHFTKSFAIVIPFICIMCSLWIINNNIYRAKLFCTNLVLFGFLSIETFTQQNIFIIYSCMEMSLIPMSIMLLCYYKKYDLKIIYKYLFYTFISALFILIGLIDIYNNTGLVMLPDIYKAHISSKLPLYMLAIGTAIKLPIFPFYYWVPCVHGKAPGICSVLLSSIVLKFSSLILVKIIVPLYNVYSYKYIGYLISIGVLISACQALCNKYLKTVLAYSSVIHMGLYYFILISKNGIKYFTYSILYHTVSMTLLFLILDLIKNRYKCLDCNKLRIKNKYYMLLIIISTIVIIDFPFTWGFITETTSILSLIQYDIVIACIVGLALLLYNSYWIYIIFTIFKNSVMDSNIKINKLYILIIAIILLPIILFGIIPKVLL